MNYYDATALPEPLRKRLLIEHFRDRRGFSEHAERALALFDAAKRAPGPKCPTCQSTITAQLGPGRAYDCGDCGGEPWEV